MNSGIQRLKSKEEPSKVVKLSINDSSPDQDIKDSLNSDGDGESENRTASDSSVKDSFVNGNRNKSKSRSKVGREEPAAAIVINETGVLRSKYLSDLQRNSNNTLIGQNIDPNIKYIPIYSSTHPSKEIPKINKNSANWTSKKFQKYQSLMLESFSEVILIFFIIFLVLLAYCIYKSYHNSERNLLVEEKDKSSEKKDVNTSRNSWRNNSIISLELESQFSLENRERLGISNRVNKDARVMLNECVIDKSFDSAEISKNFSSYRKAIFS